MTLAAAAASSSAITLLSWTGISFICDRCTHSNIGVIPEETRDNECALVKCVECETATVRCLYPGCTSSVHPSTNHAYNTKAYDPIKRFISRHINRYHKNKKKVDMGTLPSLQNAKRRKKSQDDVSYDQQSN
eukprot:scaffold25855_cov46-Cyclotella_meneghiniana.AAC.1